ncbi:MAG: FliM/FliN family flagellar motor C-terminal domain-containing protein [Paracoccaceae bacterium]
MSEQEQPTHNGESALSGDGKSSALRRKVVGAATEPSLSSPLVRALRRGFAQAARVLFGLLVAAVGGRVSYVEAEELGPLLEQDQLFLLLDGPGGARGCFVLDGEAVSAFTQHLTMGEVFDTASSERSFTRTDAAMIGPLCKEMLLRACDLADEDGQGDLFRGFAFGAYVQDAATLQLLLEGDRFVTLRLALDFAGGRRKGSALLILPDPCRPPTSLATDETPDAEIVTVGVLSGCIKAEMKAVLTRTAVTLDDVIQLKPGDVLPLKVDLDRAELFSIDGAYVATGRLGQISGSRAIRLHSGTAGADPVDPVALGFNAVEGPDEYPEDQTVKQNRDGGTGTKDVLMSSREPIEDDDAILTLSPEEVAAEITELAGLGKEDVSV